MKKLYTGIIALVILAFLVTLSVLITGMYPLKTSDGQLIFGISIGLALCIYVVAIIYLLVRKKDVSEFIVTASATLIYQVVPWIIYGLAKDDQPYIILSVVIIFLSTVIYLALFFATDVLRTLTNKADNKFKSKELAVKAENDYYDEDGNFVGTNNK